MPIWLFAAVVAVVLIPELWAMRHRRAIRRRLGSLTERERAHVELALALNRLARRPVDERLVAEDALRLIGRVGGPL